EAEVRNDQPAFSIREQHCEVRARIQIADPESATRRRVPSTRRLAVQVDSAGITESDRADIEWQNERELRDRNPQLRRPVRRCIARPMLALLSSESLR